MLTAKDVRGVCAMIPTPCIEGGDHWSVENSVDLEETARMIENMVQAGVGSFAACGTTGECAGLLWEEKLAFIDTIVQVNRGRVPVFAGATSLGTKETVRQMRAFKDVGAEAALVGLPLWQTPTIETMVQWFQDLGEAVPDMAIMVYANPWFFKSTFPPEFWAGVGKRAPTVVTAKITGNTPAPTAIPANIQALGSDQVTFLPNDRSSLAVHEAIGDKLQGFWNSSGVNMGPEPLVALWDAMEKGDKARVDEVSKDLASVPSPLPPEDFADHFHEFNAQANKAVTNAAGYIKAGPTRAPYQEYPAEYQKLSEANGTAWAEMRKRYIKAPV